jgi:hypothetical protein
VANFANLLLLLFNDISVFANIKKSSKVAIRPKKPVSAKVANNTLWGYFDASWLNTVASLKIV